jgi:hypothetical protein
VATGSGPPDGIVALDEQSLLAAAAEAVGSGGADPARFSTAALGGDRWLEGFRLLLADLQDTARLNLMGRVLARVELLRSLVARARMCDAYRSHPEVADEKVEAPLFITGMGRSGTSITHELLGQDPNLRAPLTWELLFPGLPEGDPDTWRDGLIEAADAQHAFWETVTPEYATMHENRADAPNECAMGLLAEFRSTTWGGAHAVPNYDAWLALGDPKPMFEFHTRLLQLLQYATGGPGGGPGSGSPRWVLKDPMHLARLPALFDRYPDARVVITHRDPVKVLPSVHNLMATLRWQRSDHVDAESLARLLGAAYPAMWNQVTEWRRSGAVPGDRIVDLHYSDLIADPLGAVADLYDALGMELRSGAGSAMARHLEVRPKDRHGVHSYSFDSLGLDPGRVRKEFQPYMDAYGVAPEQ